MTDNIRIGADAQVNHEITLLRSLARQGPVVSGEQIVPGIFFSLDPDSATTGECRTAEGDLIAVNFQIGAPCGWLALHLVLGEVSLRNMQIIGFVCRSGSSRANIFRAAIRSATATGFSDCFFPKQVVAFGETSTHVDLLQIAKHDSLPDEAPWRDLILFLPTESFDLAIRDLRVFIV